MDDPIVESILKERYYQPGESCWDDIAKRVANHIECDVDSRREYYAVI